MSRQRLEESRYRRMEERLWVARTALDTLLPEQVRDLLRPARCLTSEGVFRWRDDVTEKLLKLAQPRPGSEMGDFPHNERAYCPACGRSSMSPYQRGFAFPNGLLKHLRGEGNAHECPVVRFFREYELDAVADPFVLKLREHRNLIR